MWAGAMNSWRGGPGRPSPKSDPCVKPAAMLARSRGPRCLRTACVTSPALAMSTKTVGTSLGSRQRLVRHDTVVDGAEVDLVDTPAGGQPDDLDILVSQQHRNAHGCLARGAGYHDPSAVEPALFREVGGIAERQAEAGPKNHVGVHRFRAQAASPVGDDIIVGRGKRRR